MKNTNTKLNTNMISKKMSKGFDNILSPTLINLFIILSLLIILILSYLKYNKVELYKSELFYDVIPDKSFSEASSASSLLNNYIQNAKIKNGLQSILDTREALILSKAKTINEILY